MLKSKWCCGILIFYFFSEMKNDIENNECVLYEILKDESMYMYLNVNVLKFDFHLIHVYIVCTYSRYTGCGLV